MNFLDLFRLKPKKGYRVRYLDPGRRRTGAILMLLILVLSGWQLFRLGRLSAETQQTALQEEVQVLRGQVASLEAARNELLQRSTLAERSGEIEKQAADLMRENLRQKEARIQDLEEELSLYRAIVMPDKARGGLLVQGLLVTRSALPGMYDWRLVLANTRGGGGRNEGLVDIQIEGRSKGLPVKLGLTDILPEGGASVGFGFKYFQSIAGRMRLPEGFQPVTVFVRLKPRDEKIAPVEAHFPWSRIFEGG